MSYRSRLVVIGAATAISLTFVSNAARAATVLLGAHDGSPTVPGDGDGYDASGPGQFIVPADAGGVPLATFNNNNSDGLYVDGGATVTVNGGQFNNNTLGLDAFNSGITINGGTFTSSYPNAGSVYAYAGSLTVNGGTFHNGYGLFTTSAVTVRGGSFDTSIADFYVYAGNTSFDVYGQFDGLTPGQTQTLTVGGLPQTFSGTLQNETVPDTFTYRGTGGTITLHDVDASAVPEPTTAGTVLAGLTLASLARRRNG